MTNGRAHRRLGAPLLALLAFAFLLRIIVPTGWMPAHGTVGIMPCPSAAPVPAQVAQHGTGDHAGMHAMHPGGAGHEQGAPAPDDHGDKKGCDFAPLGLAWSTPSAAAFDFIPLPAQPLLARALSPVRIGQGLAAPPPPATGPPLHA